MAKTWAFLIALILAFIPASSYSEELKFLFSTDQNIKSLEPREGIPARKDILNDSWFSSPLTRIELIAYLLDQHVKTKVDYLKEVDKYFENVESKYPRSPMGNALASFSGEKGCFVVMVDISQLGKPKRPMKEFCDLLIQMVSLEFHGLGYSFQNTILSPLITTNSDDPEVLRIVGLLRKSIIVIVKLQAAYGNVKDGNPRDYYYLTGYRSTQEKETHYIKQTFSLK
jgi:hypothetical protein